MIRRRVLPVLVALVGPALAGCLDEGRDVVSPPAPATHATDCREAPDTETCRKATARTPLVVDTWPTGNRSRIGFVIGNAGDASLAFDTDPPVLWLYARTDAGAWRRVAVVDEGAAPGLLLAAQDAINVTAHYGHLRANDAEKGVSWTAAEAPDRWPAGTYRACFSAHLTGDPAWVRGCDDVRFTGR